MDICTETFLERVKQLEIKTWRYHPVIAQQIGEPGRPLHIGPMADQWAELFGGDGNQISLVDANGVLLMAVKELLARVEKLEAERG